MNKEGLTRWRKQRKASAQLASPPPLHPADWWEWATKLKKVEPSAVRGSSFQVAKCVPSVLCLQISLPPAVVSSKKVDLLYYFLSVFGKKKKILQKLCLEGMKFLIGLYSWCTLCIHCIFLYQWHISRKCPSFAEVWALHQYWVSCAVEYTNKSDFKRWK